MKTLNENESSQKVTEELDLLKVISMFWNWCIKYIWRPFLEIIRIILRRWYVFLVAILLGVALPFFMPKSEQNEIQASMEFRTFTAAPSDYVNKLKILGKQPRESWKEELKLSDEAAEHLLAIWPHYVCFYNKTLTNYFIDYTDQFAFNADFPIATSLFVVEIKTTSTEYLDEYTQAIYTYLVNDEYMNILFHEQRHKSVARLEFIQNQFSELSELRQKQNFVVYPPFSSRDNDLSTSFYDNSLEYYKIMAKMKDEAVAIDYFLKDIDSSLIIAFPMTEIVSDEDIENSNLFNFATYLFLVALVVTFLVDYRKEIAAFSKKHVSK